MTAAKSCPHVHADGRHCGAPPLTGGRHCYWHDPEKSAEADEARRLGGLRRRRERTVATAYDVAGLTSVAEVRRVFEVALLDTLGLENSVSRNRLLVTLGEAATHLLEVEREEAIAASLLLDEDD